MLAGAFSGKRVLCCDYDIHRPELRNYFDIIITDNIRYLGTDQLSNSIATNLADIIVCQDESIYNDHLLSKNLFITNKQVLLCLTRGLIEQSVKAKKPIDNYILCYDNADTKDFTKPASIGGIEIGLSAVEPLYHLARIGQAAEIFYITGNSDKSHKDCSYMSIENISAFIDEKEGYFLKNLKSLNRFGFIEKWK